MKKIDKEAEILNHAEKLFLKNGYKNTTMRQISNEANVSLGLIGYHYKSKYLLAVSCINKCFSHIKSIIYNHLDINNDPLLYYAVHVRYCSMFFLSSKYRKFYMECLEYGIYSEAVYNSNINTMKKIAEKYDINVSNDYLLLYGNYIPVEIEKTLILNKKRGLFKTISYDEIPEIIFKNALEHFISNEDLINECCKKSKKICENNFQFDY